MKILIADDNITAQNLGKKILSEAGYEVVAVSNGAAAMKKIASDKPDILLLDVYMPGYSGLEVCQKVKGAAATATLPVLLAIGQMEALTPEDSNKAKADGVITKPFESSVLLAAVQKFAEKLRSAAPPAKPKAEEPVTTVKMPAFDVQPPEPSYEAWKPEAPEAVEEQEPATAKIEVPHDMAASPALGYEEMLVQPAPWRDMASRTSADDSVPAFGGLDTHRFGAYKEAAPAAEPEPTSVDQGPAPGVEFTSAPRAGEVQVETAPELMIEEHHFEVAPTTDPALITDRTQLVTEFATKFGEEHPEEITVGIAGENMSAFAAIPEVVPEPSADGAASDLEAPSAGLEAPPFQPAAQVAAAAAAPALDSVPTPMPRMESDLSSRLVAQFSAELGRISASVPAAEPAPVATPAPLEEPGPAPPAAVEAAPAEDDEERVAAAIGRVLERVKPDLIAEIIRELKK